MKKLEKDEKTLLHSVEAGEWRSAPDREGQETRFRGYAAATFKKDRRINIRISSKDLSDLKKRALREGIPHRTLAASILHKYVSGQLRETDG